MAEGATTYPSDSTRFAWGGYDGTNFYHPRVDNATGKNLKVRLFAADGATPLLADPAMVADSEATPTVTRIASYQKLHNGVTWDMERANLPSTTLLVSAARTTTATVAVTNWNARGALILTQVIAKATTTSLIIRTRVYDIVSATYYVYADSAVWSAPVTGVYAFVIYPGATATFNGEAKGIPLPRQWQLDVVPGDANSVTYSVSVQPIN